MDYFWQLWNLLNSLSPRELAMLVLVSSFSIPTIIISAILFYRIYTIKTAGFGEKMGYVEDELRKAADTMIDRQRREAYKRKRQEESEGKVCPSKCEDSQEKIEDQLHIGNMIIRDVILERSRRSVKTRIKRNGFHNKRGLDLVNYKNTTGSTFYTDNVDAFLAWGINRRRYISLNEQGLIFTRGEAIELWGKIVDECIRISKRERNEIIQTIFFIRRFFPKEEN